MKTFLIILFGLITSLLGSADSKKRTTTTDGQKTAQKRRFESEVSFTVSRTGTSDTEVVHQEVIAAPIHGKFTYHVYQVLQQTNPNEHDIILSIRPDLPDSVTVVSYFAFEFIFSVPTDLILLEDDNTAGVITLVNPEKDYPKLLLLDNNDDGNENGRRVCLTKEGVNGNGIGNACASDGWYSDTGSFSFDYTHHELFYNDDGSDESNGQPNIYVEGTFAAETGPINRGAETGPINRGDNTGSSSVEETFKLGNGSFKLVIPLNMQ